MNDQTLPPMATPRVAAGALFFDEEGRVLLVKPTYKEGWDIPGGYVEPGESPKAACEREIREELGLDIKVGRLLVVDWAPLDGEGDKLLFIFEGLLRVQSSDLNTLSLPEGELREVGLHSPQHFGPLMPERLRVRLSAAIEAERLQSSGCYLERGVPRDQ